MSTLWTPSGEHPIDEAAGATPTSRSDAHESDDPAAEDLDELRAQLAATPAVVVIANHCYGLFELAGVYLTQRPPLLDEARLAIDALGALIEGLGTRLDDAEPAMREALAQIRMAFVQVQRVSDGHEHGSGADGDHGSD
jgi:hypothetical protein